MLLLAAMPPGGATAARITAVGALWIALHACALDPRNLSVRDGAVEGAMRPGRGASGSHSDDVADGGALSGMDDGDAGHDTDPFEEHAGGGGADAMSRGSAGEPGGTAGATLPDSGMDAGPDAGPACNQRLEVNSAWVDDVSNCFEIQGRVWGTTGDGSGGVEEYGFLGNSNPICVVVPSSRTQPTILGFNLNQTTPATPPMDYDAKVHGVIGFRVKVTATALSGMPFPFMGVVDRDGHVFCTELSGLGEHAFEFTDLSRRCWEMSGGPTPDPERIRAVVFHEPAGHTVGPIAACVDLMALVGRDPPSM